MMNTPVRIGGLLATAALVASACSSSGPATTDLGPVQLSGSLHRFDECDQLLGHLRSEAMQHVGPYGLELGGGFPVLQEFAFEGDAVAEDSAAAVAGGAEFSETNVAEVGVDEPDLVKTDGSRILAIAQGALHYVDVSGPEPVLRDSVELADSYLSPEILVAGDRVLALVPADDPFALRAETDLAAPTDGRPRTAIVEIDVSNPSNLEVVNTLTVEGSLLSGRLIDETARIVMSSPPAGFDFVYPSNATERAEELAEATNRRVIAESTLGDWLPEYRLSGDVGVSNGSLVACDAVHRPDEFAGFGMLSVLSVGLDAGLDKPEATAVLAAGQTVYASTESLYVATNRVADPSRPTDFAPDADYTTAIHKFDISGTEPARYEASGSVRGHVLNQFALSERADILRVATTDGAPWAAVEGSESYVTTFGQQGHELVQQGQVGDLGRGEQIFAVRFVGDVGYVVTFRQVDPLYTVDLSDPTDPTVVGELKIPGYSAYLHPLGDDRLIGVGQDADLSGVTTGLSVSVFDVSDLARPDRVSQYRLDSGRSEVEFDHRAFLHWPDTGLALLPVEVDGFDEGNFVSSTGALGLRIDESEITEIEVVRHDDGSRVRRSLVVGDRVFTLSETSLAVSALDALAPISELSLG